MKVREPVARPLDVVSVELLLSASQAFLVGVLMYLAIGAWDDRGVGSGPVAIILALLGAAIGGSWLYWLLGGVGWPLATANVPAALFLGFALLLGWQGEVVFRVEGVPALLALAASVYGIVCGVFLDSPRRWRWDQRKKPRPGTSVPRVSPTTQALLAQVPRSLPGRGGASSRPSGPAMPWLEQPAPASGDLGIPYLAADEPTAAAGGMDELTAEVTAGPLPAGQVERGGAAQTRAGQDVGTAGRPTAAVPSERPRRPARTVEAGGSAATTGDGLETGSEPEGEPATIELPTSLEPRAQRSPWAWAAPPEWNREEDDTPPRGRSSGRS